MKHNANQSALCEVHGDRLVREMCKFCNAAYMRAYQQRKRRADPITAMLLRAKERARISHVAFELTKTDLAIPNRCPAFGWKISAHGPRSPFSPSLDRIIPLQGYVRGNVRVICDRANQLKYNYNIEQIAHIAKTQSGERGALYGLLKSYMDRELLLKEVLNKADSGAAGCENWREIYDFLNRIFLCGTKLRALSGDTSVETRTS